MEVGERPYYLRPIVSNTSLGNNNVFYDSTSSSDSCSSMVLASSSNSTSSTSSEETCFICFEKINSDDGTLPTSLENFNFIQRHCDCVGMCHELCLCKWLYEKNSCPICRSGINITNTRLVVNARGEVAYCIRSDEEREIIRHDQYHCNVVYASLIVFTICCGIVLLFNSLRDPSP